MNKIDERTKLKKWGTLWLGVGIAFVIFIMIGVAQPTYQNADQLVADFRTQSVSEGDTVKLKVLSIEDTVMYGHVVWVADDVILIGDNTYGLNKGDTITISIIDANKVFGVWMIDFIGDL